MVNDRIIQIYINESYIIGLSEGGVIYQINRYGGEWEVICKSPKIDSPSTQNRLREQKTLSKSKPILKQIQLGKKSITYKLSLLKTIPKHILKRLFSNHKKGNSPTR